VLLRGVGIGIGLVASLGLARWISSLLYAVSPSDPAMLAGTCTLLLGGSLIASYIPARRAARVDPMVALRCE
jgi:putative ABC transport system permease protein